MKRITILGVALLLIMSACKSGRTNDENVQKLLDRQAEMQELQEESVDQLQGLKDSLSQEKKSLLDQRDSSDRHIRRMEENQRLLVDRLKDKAASDVASDRDELEKRINEYEDSIRILKGELELLNSRLDSLEENISFYEVQEGQTGQYVQSGIAEIDQRMTSRENRKQQEIKRLDLLKCRAQVADKKIEAYNLEKQMYADQRDDLLRSNASDEDLAPYQKKISELDSTILAEENNKSTIEKDIQQAGAYISQTDTLMSNLQAQVKQEYNKKSIIESFINSELERLGSELEQIEQNRKELLARQASATESLKKAQQEVGQLEKNAELIRNRKMSDILEMQARIEGSEADLADEEINQLKEGNVREGRDVSLISDTADEGLVSLLSLGEELDSLNELIRQEKTSIAETRKELARKRAEVAQKRASFARTTGALVLVLIIGGIALLSLFYYLGRRSRNKSSK
jgi:chromosome segregation ATPase